VVFSVDIFNEGVDVPSVDTLIMLRPTDSPILFLQQLGRGLRRNPGKRACTVIDLVGLHRNEFRFDPRFAALLGGTRKDIERQVAEGFPFLPAGCHMELDRVASERVLRSIRNAVPDRWTAKVEELRRLAAGGKQIKLDVYLEQTGLALEDIYSSGRSWSDLLSAAGLPVLGTGPAEEELRKAVGRLLHVDDARRIETYAQFLSDGIEPDAEAGTILRQRYLRMLVASVIGNACPLSASLQDACKIVWGHPQVISELRELMDILLRRIQHAELPLTERPTLPLSVHARYTRIEIQAAFGDGANARVPVWREGVRWMKGEQCDVFVFTLDKTSGRFSPTTRYRDYAISRELVHWESQSMIRESSPTGLRYQSYGPGGLGVMLFGRLRDDDRAFYLLGPAEYVSHESESPMAITWRLRYPLSGDLFQSFAAAVA
jgi:hypothetical protein